MSVKNVVRLALLALVATPSLLSAQDTSRTQRALDALGQTAKPGTYSGTVRDSALRPIVDAEVFLSGDSEERSLLTNTSGMFVFSDLAPGRYTIFVRRLGYQPQQRVVYIATGERHSTLIQLVALPMHLPDVEVRAKSGMNLSPALERMYRTAWGRTLTRADIEQRGQHGLSFLVGRYLRTQPFSRFDLLRPSNGWDPFGRTAPAPRLGTIRGCPPAISINGQPPWRDLFVGDFPTWSIEAIDIYQPGADARLPAAFQVTQGYSSPSPGAATTDINACGLIVLWTR